MTSAAAAYRSSSAPTNRRSSGIGRWAAAIAILAALAAAVAWWLGWFEAPIDPRVAEIRTMRDDVAARYQASGPASLADATAMMAAMGQIRQKIDALPEHLRPQAERGGGSMFRASMRARIDAYFNAPPGQRDAILDRQIDQEEWIRKAYEAAQTVTAASGGTAGQPQGGPRGSTTEDERNKFRKGIIDRTSPAERARYVEYWRAAAERREKRGMPASPWGR